jgi:diketogulonate reductase-like aldo/keto reductase
MFALGSALGAIPTLPIAPGVDIPLAGLGTWQYNNSVAYSAVLTALKDVGYTHIDTAIGYGNQVGVGKAIADSERKRSDIFITSKIPGGLTQDDAAKQLSESVDQLFPGDDKGYVDLMLVHFPAAWSGEGGKALRQAEWKALEAFQRAGKTRAIGVSHYCRKHLDDVLAIATIKPAINQVQFHVGMGTAGANATDDREYHKKVGVTYQSFSPLCGPCDGSDATELISGKLVTSIGAKYKKTGAQVALKWQVQQGIPVIPKTHSAEHMKQNIELFDWTLAKEDMDALTGATVPAVAGNMEHGVEVSGDCDVL